MIIFAVEAIVLVCLVGVLFFVSKLDKMQSGDMTAVAREGEEENLSDVQVEENTNLDEATTAKLEKFTTIALFGVDSRTGILGKGSRSDTIIIASINNETKEVKLCSVFRDTYLNMTNGTYNKANAAYAFGGPDQAIRMLNLNLDLNITEYVTVDFSALCTTIELLGGLDIEMTREELIHLNNYNKETAPACNMEYVEIEVPPADEYDGAMLRTFHLNGSQAVSYARIRKTAGNDFRRASRQRVVLSKIMEKAKMADIVTLDAVLNAVLPLVTTNLDNGKIVSMIRPVLEYSMPEENQTGFPFAHVEDDGTITGLDCVLPVTLEYNVRQLHEFLFPGTEYTPSPTVQTYSQQIIYDSGYAEEDIEWALAIDDGAEIPKWSQELQNQADAAAEGY